MNQQNSGKASILCEATKFLKDVFGQSESLRKEQTALLSESNYLTTEKNELKEETSVLETEISRLHSEIEARVNQSKPDLNTSPAPDCLSTIINSIPNLHLSVQDSLFSKEPAFNNLLQLLLVPRLLSFQCILISRHKILQTWQGTCRHKRQRWCIIAQVWVSHVQGMLARLTHGLLGYLESDWELANES